ncbi:hypothetical protein GCM10007913_29490 [Devosia yakushimensis]|uniref:Uncharacterized protein n=1 Tax=Devosia yakushimensis TaxID=470028 RepID=A0ABQ5UFZ1_9HYPH|nr:hypothetical protein [Devosia yakushimensis]GLQ11017.1 hypothetical protein GCM10007913_29490 [Devosia yakushimensis]
MVHFFGILNPEFGPRVAAADAPLKAGFFGGAPEPSLPSRAEMDADFLAGKRPEPADEPDDEELRFVRFCLPPHL